MSRTASAISILGGGSWGTALALLAARNGHRVTVWEFNRELADRVRASRRNPDFLPGITIPEEVRITSELDEAAAAADCILIAVPSHVVREVTGALAALLPAETLLVSCSKGIENDTLKPVTDVIAEMLPRVSAGRIAVLSGPSHAEEVARAVPTAVTVASRSGDTAETVQSLLMSPAFRVYTSPDLTGVELGGALKNVIAVAAGIIDGVGGGDNTKAALMTRGIVEITRLGAAMGADPLTFAGLSGMGDLIVTCMSRHSRNRYLGEQIGRGNTLAQVLAGMVQVAEGVRTAKSVRSLSRRLKVQMPISDEVYNVLFEDKPAKEAVHDLMTRDPKQEDWG
ncbi:NAD(P)H-dependent glycerol-3-phosphate dehydrogenase [bacterium]|nr:NAD(P)H-dependent glycerol-3-phosphate dehydrogenase [bacterium]